MHTLALISIRCVASGRFESLAPLLERALTLGIDAQVLLVDVCPEDLPTSIPALGQGAHPVRTIRMPGGAWAKAVELAISQADARWVMFHDLDRPPDEWHLECAFAFLRDRGDVCVPMILSRQAIASGSCLAGCSGELLPLRSEDVLPEGNEARLFRLEWLRGQRISLDPRVRPDFAQTLFALQCLLLIRASPLGWVDVPDCPGTRPLGVSEPPTRIWIEPATYGEALVHGHLALLEQSLDEQAKAPRWLQAVLLRDLQWYFVVDARERAPTLSVTDALAAEFHAVVERIMKHIDPEAVDELAADGVQAEIRQALLSYKRLGRRSPVSLDAFDHERGLARISYCFDGRRPQEDFFVDGRRAAPAWAKYRSCVFYRRSLAAQRIAWIPIERSATRIECRLDGDPAQILVGPAHRTASAQSGPFVDLDGARRALCRQQRGGESAVPADEAGWKARLLRWLADRSFVRKRLGGCWLFLDRESEADDNAEHMYRWTRLNAPQVPIRFLLSPSSPDWRRLKDEGFQLVAPGLKRKLLLLTSEHIISSQPDYALGGFDPKLYADRMRWKFTYLRHGTQINDQSHWLNGKRIDCILASSEPEYRSLVDDGTPYVFTGKEVKLTGLPRHDRLLQLSEGVSAIDIDTILVMPTWRSSLSRFRGGKDAFDAVRRSEYVLRWCDLLGDERLRQVVRQYRKRLVFMLHPNAAPYRRAFELPDWIEVVTKAEVSIQDLFSRAAILVTDYSSVAFDVALLRRPVVYYQFDQERFFGGDHNWRPGAFRYDRDGFGPVVADRDGAVDALQRILARGGQPAPEHLARMQRWLPLRDGDACRRTFEAILELRRPFVATELTPTGIPLDVSGSAAFSPGK